MTGFIIFPEVEHKLTHKHNVSIVEIEEARLYSQGPFVRDVRQLIFPRWWFISATLQARRLKIVYWYDHEFADPILLTAYAPNLKEETAYAKAIKNPDWPKAPKRP
jgi:hypothetical protein